MKVNLKLSVLFVLLLFLCSCNSKENKDAIVNNQSAYNNLYELSEMALLMEEMYSYYNQKKSLVSQKDSLGEVPPYFDEIYTAELTEGFVHDELLRNYSDVFIKNVKLLHNSKTADKTELYNDVIYSCIACHKSEVGCMGPIPRIEKLLIQ